MRTRVDEIAERIYGLSTFLPDISPTGFTFNQFPINADEPTIFHTALRRMFTAVSTAITSLMPLDRPHWIMFGHLEGNECGVRNLFLEAAPDAPVADTALGCMVPIDDLADQHSRVVDKTEMVLPTKPSSSGVQPISGRAAADSDTEVAADSARSIQLSCGGVLGHSRRSRCRWTRSVAGGWVPVLKWTTATTPWTAWGDANTATSTRPHGASNCRRASLRLRLGPPSAVFATHASRSTRTCSGTPGRPSQSVSAWSSSMRAPCFCATSTASS